MPKVVNCRSCKKEYQIVARKYIDGNFERGILCISCWNKPTSTTSKVGGYNIPPISVIANSKPSEPSKSTSFGKFEVGNKVYFRNQNDEIMKGEIIDIHEYGEGYVFYNVCEEKTGKTLDYLSDVEIFFSAEMARSGKRVLGV